MTNKPINLLINKYKYIIIIIYYYLLILLGFSREIEKIIASIKLFFCKYMFVVFFVAFCRFVGISVN